MANTSARILIVDDEFSVRDSLTHWFKKDGYEVVSAENAKEALSVLGNKRFDVALLDIKMPGMDGMELQERIHKIDPAIAIIMITAFASVDTAVRALKQGAFDYVTKPISPDELSHLVARAVNTRKLEHENEQLREAIDGIAEVDTIIGKSEALKAVLQQVKQVAQTNSVVLISGESGTGKELIARAIHWNSKQRYAPLIPVNCGAIPEGLLESELFGHEKGAFTGAHSRRKGKIEMADGGTLFLDEVGTIAAKTQIDLLRVLETKEFTRVGGNQVVKVDFRVICATNEDLAVSVAEGRFREDLYYRVNVFPIVVPPLRERREDIPLLAKYFVQKFALEMEKRITDIDPEALDQLSAYEWPGNVRELANAIERAMVVGKPPKIRPDDLPFLVPPKIVSEQLKTLAAIEEQHIVAVLNETGWNISQTAKILGVDRATLYNKIKKYGLSVRGA